MASLLECSKVHSSLGYPSVERNEYLLSVYCVVSLGYTTVNKPDKALAHLKLPFCHQRTLIPP